VNPGTRSSGLPETSGITGSPSHQEPRVPGVTRNSGFPESPGTPGCWTHPDLRVPGITQTFVFPESPVSPGFRSHPELCVTGVTRISGNPEFRVTPGTGVPGDSFFFLILFESCQQNRITYTTAVCTVKTPDDGRGTVRNM
jgi:hypothetical protein